MKETSGIDLLASIVQQQLNKDSNHAQGYTKNVDTNAKAANLERTRLQFSCAPSRVSAENIGRKSSPRYSAPRMPLTLIAPRPTTVTPPLSVTTPTIPSPSFTAPNAALSPLEDTMWTGYLTQYYVDCLKLELAKCNVPIANDSDLGQPQGSVLSQLSAASLNTPAISQLDALLDTLSSNYNSELSQIPSLATQNHEIMPTLPSLPQRTTDGNHLFPVATTTREDWILSPYQCLLRQQMCYLVTDHVVNDGKTRGRNKAIVPGQVGLVCKYCANHRSSSFMRGSVYYPAELRSIYHAAQNMAVMHFPYCPGMPRRLRDELWRRKQQGQPASTGSGEYWKASAREFGLVEQEEGLFLIGE